MPAPSVETKIWLALRARVETLAMTTAWPGEPFTPPRDAHLQVDLLPAQPDRFLLAGPAEHRRRGVLQIAYMAPLSGRFEPKLEAAGEIAAQFPSGLKLSFDDVEVKIRNAPTVGRGLRDGSHWRIPVSINWQAFA